VVSLEFHFIDWNKIPIPLSPSHQGSEEFLCFTTGRSTANSLYLSAGLQTGREKLEGFSGIVLGVE
jgi:hypothetical protein